jgi:hypothetical protein
VDQLYPNIPLGSQLKRLVEVETRLQAMAPSKVETIQLPDDADIRWIKNDTAMIQRGGQPYTTAMLGRNEWHDLIHFEQCHDLERYDEGETTEDRDLMSKLANSAYDVKRGLLLAATM